MTHHRLRGIQPPSSDPSALVSSLMRLHQSWPVKAPSPEEEEEKEEASVFPSARDLSDDLSISVMESTLFTQTGTSESTHGAKWTRGFVSESLMGQSDPARLHGFLTRSSDFAATLSPAGKGFACSLLAKNAGFLCFQQDFQCQRQKHKADNNDSG